MPPEIASALAVLIGTLSTAILMAATFYFGPVRRENRKAAKQEDS